MLRLPLVSVVLLTALASLAAPSIPVGSNSSAARFGQRAYRTGSHEVVVAARGDVFAVRLPARSGASQASVGATASDAAVKATVQTLLAKVAGAENVVVTRAWTLQKHGLVAVSVSDALSPAQLAALADAVAVQAGGHLWPALTRPGTGPGPNGQGNRAFADDRLVVTAEAGQLEAVLAKNLSKLGGVVVARSERLRDTAIVAVGAAVSFDAVEASRALAGVPGVVSAEPNLYRELAAKGTVNDPLYPRQWHLARNAGQNVPGGDSEFGGTIHADVAWDTTKGDPDVVVAIFDSGTDWNHPDLLANVRQDLMFDSSDDGDVDPSPECEASQDGIDVSPLCPNDEPFRESHGTAVSGTVAAVGDNTLGLSGVCPQCALAPVRLLGAATNDAMSIAESFARSCDPTNDRTGQGAWIINNSWGPGFSLFFPLSQPERDAFDLCRDVGRAGKGTVIVFAAGNDTSNVAADAYAKHPYVVGVAASTNIDDWAAYSNYGAEIDVAAPSLGGVVNEDNFGIVTTDVRGPEGYSIDAGAFDTDYTTDFSGTSAASPVTAGLAGLILSANPDLSAEQVRLVMTATTDKIRADKVPWEQFFGQDLETLFDYDDDGHSIAFGYGRINAARAVSLAADPVALSALLGTAGARCPDGPTADCPICSAEGTCLTSCTSQDDCPDGSVCNLAFGGGASGACELPRIEHTAFLEPCNADCTYCVGTLDTEFQNTSICSQECTTDASCDPRCAADGGLVDESCTTETFDCRPITDDPAGPAICAVGSPDSGGPADFNACPFNAFAGVPTLVKSEEGKELCGESCFADGPGACPYGFHCADAVCECTRVGGNGGCRELTCSEAGPGGGDLPLCLPDPGHADICKTDLDCQRGDYCFKADPAVEAGDCRFDDRAGCDICQGCRDSSECAGRGTCLGANENELGVCTIACDDGEACPDGSSCRTISVPFFNGRLRQFEACLGDGGDEQVIETTPQEACLNFTCEVACRADVPCGAGQVCDDGACVAAPAVSEGEGEGSGDTDGLRLSGGGPNCGGCSSGGDVGFGALPLALLALLKLRRRKA